MDRRRLSRVRAGADRRRLYRRGAARAAARHGRALGPRRVVRGREELLHRVARPQRHPIDVGDVPSYLRLAFDGHNYVATWSVQSAAYAQFFRPNGQPLGPRRRAGFGAATRAVWTGREFVTIDTSAFGAVVAEMEDGTGRELGELGQRSLFVDAVADGGDVVIALVDVDRDELQLVRFS